MFQVQNNYDYTKKTDVYAVKTETDYEDEKVTIYFLTYSKSECKWKWKDSIQFEPIDI